MADELPNSQARAIAQRVQQFRFSIELLERSYTELSVFLRYVTSTEITLGLAAQSERWRQHEAIRETIFLLHNFVAAALSLVDHSRVLYRHLYEPTELIPEYQQEIDKRFVSDPLSNFVIGLRQMAQHYRLPNIQLTRSFRNDSGQTTFEAKLLLRTDDLRTFGGWKAPAKRFLDESGAEIDVAELATQYHVHVMNFYDWFGREQAKVHGLGPAVFSHMVKFGLQFPGPTIIGQLQENIAALEAQPRETLTFELLHEALVPALTILDSRLLMLCHHDPIFWIEQALAAISRRFEIPTEVSQRLYSLVQHADP